MAYKWAFSWMGNQKWKLAASSLLNILAVALMTLEPYIFSDIIDKVLMPQRFERLVPMLLLALGVGVGFMAIRYVSNVLAEQAAQNAVYGLRSALFSKLLKQTGGFYSENRSGDLINKCTGDVETLNHFLCWCIPKAVEAVLMLTFVLGVFLTINPIYTLILFSLTPFTAIVAVKLSKNVRPAFRSARDQLSVLNTVVQENISGNRVVKAFVREDYEIDKFQKENQEYRRRNVYANYVWLKYGPIIDSLSSLLTVMNLVVGGIMVVNGSISLGQLQIFLSLAWALNEPMALIGTLVNDTQRFNASMEKVMGLYYSSVDIDNPQLDRTPESVTGHVELKNVSLKMDGFGIINGIDMDIPAGSTIGIMGPTGSGKTTLVNLIARFTDVTGGEVLLDGVNVKDYNLQTLRGCVGVAMQDVFLFSDTVESNIVYGVPEAPMEIVELAAEVSDSYEFISKMQEGYDTIIGERGTGLSGGQKQRISLARAIAKDAPVLILDDTTSAVDMDTENYIQAKLRELPKKATTIIIAQRISSVMHADKIYILDNGRIAESGSHNELMANKGYYYNTCMLQHGSLEDDAEEEPSFQI